MASTSGRQARGSPPTTTTTTTTTTRQSPSQLPLAVLLIYPVTILVGSLFATISPTAQPSQDHAEPLAPTIATDLNLSPPPHPINYFARKNNIFNQYFVKIGWAWTTLAFVSLLAFQPAYAFIQGQLPTNQQQQQQRLLRIAQSLLRYAIATLSWYLTTQWFFGPPIIDRGFLVTGGKCERAVEHVMSDSDSADSVGGHLGTLFTAAACKAAGGNWKGGYDVSGHVFMLVLATVFLVFEAVGVTGTAWVGSENQKEKRDDGDNYAGSSETERVDSDNKQDVLRIWSLRFVWAVVGLSWWMLLMTAIWFHTWLEKWSGLLIAIGTAYIIYFLPRTLVPWRNIVGIPGV